MKRVLVLVVIIVGLTISTTSCSKAKDAANKTIEATEKAAEDTKNAVKNAVKDAAEKTVEATKDATDAVKDGAIKAVDVVKNAAVDQAKLDRGKVLFTSKTCTACHQIEGKLLGPSVKEIIKIYDEKGANLVKFLKGNAPAIVDTDPGQVAIMKANIDGFLKDMKADDLQALAAYMRSVAK